MPGTVSPLFFVAMGCILSAQPGVKEDSHCSHYYFPCASQPIPSPASARRPSLMTLISPSISLFRTIQLSDKLNVMSHYSGLVFILSLHLKPFTPIRQDQWFFSPTGSAKPRARPIGMLERLVI